jgi:hypothetical protein
LLQRRKGEEDAELANGVMAMTEEECYLMLGMTGVGRLVVLVDGQPEVFPVNHCRDGDTIVFRTSSGTKLAASTGGQRVAYEVDVFDRRTRTGWSVVVKGTAEEIVDPAELSTVSGLPLRPWAPDPLSRYVRLTPHAISGRRLIRLRDGFSPS